MKLAPLPKSKAKTPYQLLNDVIKAIKAEPKRLDMDSWCQLKSEQYESDDFPACGTTACIAGWAYILATNSTRKQLKNASIFIEARRILHNDGSSKLLNDLDRLFFIFPTNAPVGTKEYVNYVVKEIRLVMKTHKKELTIPFRK